MLFSTLVGLGLGFELDLLPGWLVVMHTQLFCFPLSLSLSVNNAPCLLFAACRPIVKHLAFWGGRFLGVGGRGRSLPPKSPLFAGYSTRKHRIGQHPNVDL